MNEEQVQEGFTDDEALQAIKEKLEENEFHREASAVPEVEDDSASEDEGDFQQEEAPQAASHTEISAAYARLQHDANILAAATVQVEQLRHTNPAEYAIAVNDIIAARRDLANREQQLTQAYQQVTSESLAKEQKKLLKAIPEWKNPEIAEQEKAELRDFLRKRGYSDAEISQATARDIVTARDAMLRGRDKPKRTTIPGFKKPARSNAIRGLDPVTQKNMERNIKHGTGDDIELRLIRSGYA